jgi:predicted phosphodiesterase
MDLVASKNLFNPADAGYLKDRYLRVNSGVLALGEYEDMYNTTGYVPVQPGNVAIFSRLGEEIMVYAMTYYSANKTWLGPTNFFSNVYGSAKTAPAGAAYLRASVCTDRADVDSLQIEITSTGKPTAHRPFGRLPATFELVQKRIVDIEDACALGIRPYYISEALKTVQSTIAAITSRALVLSVFTDAHYNDVAISSRSGVFFDTVRNIKYVNHLLRSDAVVCLGDMINAGEHDTQLKLHSKLISSLLETNPKVLIAVGNHDFNGSEYAEVFSGGEIYALSQHLNESIVVRDGINPRYYIDYPNRKVRVIVLQTSRDSGSVIEQAMPAAENKAWLANTALDTPDGYTVVVLSHYPLNAGLAIGENIYGGSDILGILNAYARQASYTDSANNAVYDFSTKTGTKVACVLYGHTHVDNIYQDPGLTFPQINIACAKKEQVTSTLPSLGSPSSPERDWGAITSDLWDNVVILPAEKKIKLIRFGAGSDRTATYT